MAATSGIAQHRRVYSWPPCRQWRTTSLAGRPAFNSRRLAACRPTPSSSAISPTVKQSRGIV